MRPYTEGENLYNLIRQTIPSFVEADYPLFIEFMTAYLRFLEEKRVLVPKNVYPEYGSVPESTVMATETLGGSFYETRKLLEYLDVQSTLDEFKTHFLNAFGENFPQYQYVSLDFLVRSLRQFYQAKGTVDSVQWFFRVLFNEHAEVYFPRTDIIKASDGTWIAPITLKVSAPINSHPNSDVPLFYVGQRVQTGTGSAQVESIVTYIVGQAFNQNIVVNELNLKFDTILGFFQPGQTLFNIDSDIQVETVILPVISDVIIDSGGANYLAGDIVEFSEGPGGGYGFGAFGIVSQVSNTAINGVTVVNGGDGYITGLPCVFVSTSGHGANAVIQEVVYGDFLLEDGTGYITQEQQTAGETNYLQLEDSNVLFLELLIEPFVNATSTVIIEDPDYGTESGVTQLIGVGFDSEIELALAAVDEKPFMHPWVFTNPGETVATLANAETDITYTTNTFFANGASIFQLSSFQDLTSNLSNSPVTANVIVSQVQQGGQKGNLFLKDFVGLNLLTNGTIWKENGTGTLQVGSVSSDGTANVFGTNTVFTDVVKTNATLRFDTGQEFVVKQVVNDTFLVAWSAIVNTITANSYSIIPVAQVTSITPQQQRYYGKIKTVRLVGEGVGYLNPPAVTVDSVSGRAQELYYLDPGVDNIPGTPDDVITAAADQVHVFTQAELQVQQDSGQIQKIKIVNSGVNYQDANSVQITAVHGSPRTGANAVMEAVVGALSRTPGQFTTSRGFLSADKFIQDSTFYNDYTYVIRVGESFDRYKDILLSLLHPAGFQPLGTFVATVEAAITLPDADAELDIISV